MKIVWGLFGTLVLTTAAEAVPIVIQVNGPDDLPVAGAEVRAAHYGDVDPFAPIYQTTKPIYETARTDAKGVARFDWDVTKARFVAGATSQFMGTATVWTPKLGVFNLIVRSGENVAKLGAAGVARGIVRDEKGAPVAGAQVRVMIVSGPLNGGALPGSGGLALPEEETAFTATSDGEGHWEIGGLTLGGRARVQLEGAAYAGAMAIAPIVAPDAPPVIGMDKPKNGTISQNGELRALPAATLTGRIVKPDGTPSEGVMVWARPLDNATTGYYNRVFTTTDARGEYSLKRLPPGSYKVTPRTPAALSLVADNGTAPTVKVASGQTQKVPEQKLIAGGSIVVQVTDAKTGKSLANVGAIMQATDGTGMEIPLTARGDDKGRIQIYLAPGNYRVRLWQPPEGYTQLDKQQDVAKVVAGETQNLALKLQPGVLAQGRLVDENGKIVPNIYFALSAAKQEMWGGVPVLADEKGIWKTQSFPPGDYKVSLNQSEKWELVGPKTFTIPTTTPVEIKIKPLAQTALAGRIVDSAGAGMAGVAIKAKITTQVDNSQSEIDRQSVTDAQGQYTLPSFPTTAVSIVLKPTRAGYTVEKAPEIKNENNVWSTTDVVLQALSSHLGGTVVDAQNVPQQGVQVLAARLGSVAVSDEKGAWKFDALAPGEIEIVAVGAAGAVAHTVSAGRDDVSLKLQPFVPAKPSDIAGASAVLDDAWQTSQSRKYYSRAYLPATLAPYDPDAALALARRGDNVFSEITLLKIVELSARSDAQRAHQWVPQVLAGLKNPDKLSVELTMARALIATNPDAAHQYLLDSKALYETLDNESEKRDAVSWLAVLSAQLELPDAPLWFERSLALAAKNGKRSDYRLLAWRLGAVNVAWATQAVEAASKVVPEPGEYSPDPEAVASAAIRSVAKWDLPKAQKLLAKYRTLSDDNGDREIDRARSALIIETLRKNHDVDAALTGARELNDSKMRTLSKISALARVERRGEILREALALARTESTRHKNAIRLAWQLLPYDRAFAKKTLDEIRLLFDEYDPARDRYARPDDIAWWAFAYRDIDAVQARWILEREWARVFWLEHSPENDFYRIHQTQNLILAMATIDLPRAQQLIFSLPIDEEGGAPFGAAQVLARWMLASEDERQTRAFDEWGDAELEDGLYAEAW